jgi:hypothetical protein
MKKARLLVLLLIPLVAIGILISCDNGVTRSGYFIFATIVTTEYDWKHGVSGVSDDAFGEIIDIASGDTLLFASPTVVVGEPDNYVWFEFNGITTGTYDLSDMLDASYRIEGEYWDFLTLSLTVNKYEDVGGDIEGTFAGTIENEAGTIQRVVYGGQFRVVRVANEAFIP